MAKGGKKTVFPQMKGPVVPKFVPKLTDEQKLTVSQAEEILANEAKRKEDAEAEAQRIIAEATTRSEEIVADARNERERLISENASLVAENGRIQAEFAEKKHVLLSNEDAQAVIASKDQIIAEATATASTENERLLGENEQLLAQNEQLRVEIDEKRAYLMTNEAAQAIIDDRDTLIAEATSAADSIKAEAARTAETTVNDANTEADEVMNNALAEATEKVESAKKEADSIITDANLKAASAIEEAQANAQQMTDNVVSEAKKHADEIIATALQEEKVIVARKEETAEIAAKAVRQAAEDYALRVRGNADKYAELSRANAEKEAARIEAESEKQVQGSLNAAQELIDAQKAAMEARAEKLHRSEVAFNERESAWNDRAEQLVSERLAARTEELEAMRTRLAEKEGSLRVLEENLKWKAESLESEKKSFDSLVEQEVEQRHSTILGELTAAKENEKRLSETNRTLNDTLRTITERYRSLKGDNAARLQQENEELQGMLHVINSYGITAQNAQAVANAQKEVVDLREKIAQMGKDLTDARNTTALLSGKEDELAQAISTREMYKSMVEGLTKKLDERKSVSRAQMLLPIQEPVQFLSASRPVRDPEKFRSEIAWLRNIHEQMDKSQIIISERLLYAYHTSLKIGEWSPMVVLAGVSGTGKSELPKQYARHGGMHFLSVPVKPDWDSPSSLFGYYNAIENRFEATELLRALYQMQDEYSDDMFVVLLDEMNLAHPEQYFADLLSKFEEMRGSTVPAEYDIVLGAGEKPEKLKIARNVLWTGTMNEDETTKGLSDKVIDRSIVITFPCPKVLHDRDNTPIPEPKLTLSRSLWENWKQSALRRDATPELLKTLEGYKQTIQIINSEMSNMGRNLGHRVWQSIENYILNYPTVIETAGQKHEEVEKAFCDAIAFKMMPKLRGLETRGNNEDYLSAIKNALPHQLQGDFENALDQTSEVFRWNSANFMED